MSIESKIEIISVDEKVSIHFIHVPDDYKVKKFDLSEHKTQVIGRLKQFNKYKIISSWKEGNKDLVKFFTQLLSERGWDFEKYPNPIGVLAYYTE